MSSKVPKRNANMDFGTIATTNDAVMEDAPPADKTPESTTASPVEAVNALEPTLEPLKADERPRTRRLVPQPTPIGRLDADLYAELLGEIKARRREVPKQLSFRTPAWLEKRMVAAVKAAADASVDKVTKESWLAEAIALKLAYDAGE